MAMCENSNDDYAWQQLEFTRPDEIMLCLDLAEPLAETSALHAISSTGDILERAEQTALHGSFEPASTSHEVQFIDPRCSGRCFIALG